MLRSTLSAAVLSVASLVAVGCGPKWRVVQQAQPNPMVGKTEFAVMPISYEGLKVGEKSEAEYLAGKDEGQRESFEGDKRGMQDKFDMALKSAALDEGINVSTASGEVTQPFVIVPHVGFVEPGFYAVVASGASFLTMRVKITTNEGAVLDEIEVEHSTDSRSGASIGGISLNPSSGGRLRDDAEWIGQAVGEYVISRVIPEE